jgi:iron complex outermembrane receptor protein
MQNRKLAVALGLLGATMLSTPAGAQVTTESIAPVGPQTAASPEQAQLIETVVVTARRRAENLERVPVAVTAVSPETLRVNTVRGALDLQQLSPSLTVSASLGSRDDNVFTIRGQSQPFGGADPGVQNYFNEVPLGASGPGNYYDMDNIQILRGPQGTLFGRNTTGGAILFQPKKPTDQFGGYVDVSAGDFGMREAQGAVNLPIVGDKLAIRVAGDIARRKGFTQNVTFGTDVDNMRYDAVRVGITARPFAGFENYLVFSYLNNTNRGTGGELTAIAPESQLEQKYGPQITQVITPLIVQQLVAGGMPLANAEAAAPALAAAQASAQIQGLYYGYMQPALAAQQALGARQTMSSVLPSYKRHTWSLTDTAQYDITQGLHLRNIFGYLSDKAQPAFDYDGSSLPILDIPNLRTWEADTRQITEEIQLLGESDEWTWIAGVYYEHDYPGGYSEVERDVFGGATGPFAPLGSTEIDSLSNGGTSMAVYGSATYDASGWVEGLSFTAGGRWTWDHKVAKSIVCVQGATDPPCPFPIPATSLNSETDSASFHAPTWTLAANYQVTDDTLLYGTFRRGYKSGGFNSGAAQTGYTLFKPEFLTDIELGTKNNWSILGVPGRTNFDLYYGFYQDVQKNDLVAIETTSSPLRLVALTANAAKATVKGLELESTFIPDENLQVSVFYSYAEASYDKFELPQAILIDSTGNAILVNPLDHKGDPFAYTPQHKLGLTGRLHLPIDSSFGMPYLTATWYWQSKVWFTDLSDLEPHAFQPDYGLLNLRLDWNNYLDSSFDLSLFVNNLTDRTYKVGANALEHLTGTTASIYGAPRMWGVELRYRFGAEAEQ